jgi:hypothetical protein
MIERSHGKARPTLVRSSDLAQVKAAKTPTEGRTAHGHFAAGNPIGLGSRWKASIKKSLGPKATEGEARAVYGDALRIYLATLRAMPSDAAPVRSLAALHGRHMAVNAYYTTKAAEAGLDTPAGQKLQDLANRESQRAERVLVSCIDVATKLVPKGQPRSSVTALRQRVAAAVDVSAEGEPR